MSTTPESPEAHDGSGRYEIRLKGHLDNRWADWFDSLIITREDNGDTLLTGPLVDQAALHGVLRKVRDLGMPLISVIQIEAKPANGPEGSADTDHNRSTKPIHEHQSPDSNLKEGA